MAKQLIRENNLPSMELVDIDAGFFMPAKISKPQKTQSFQLSLKPL
jgi:hypothetical protein